MRADYLRMGSLLGGGLGLLFLQYMYAEEAVKGFSEVGYIVGMIE